MCESGNYWLGATTLITLKNVSWINVYILSELLIHWLAVVVQLFKNVMLIVCREAGQGFVFVFPVVLHVYSTSVAEKVLWCGFTSILYCLENKFQIFRCPKLLPTHRRWSLWRLTTGGLKEQQFFCGELIRPFFRDFEQGPNCSSISIKLGTGVLYKKFPVFMSFTNIGAVTVIAHWRT
jgi:hypothetical protein